MGIEGLWKLLDSDGVTEKQSLRTLAIAEGFEGPRNDRLYHIGVDLNIWIQQLQQVFAVGHARSGENPELRTFFYRLAMLAERPVHMIFVVDGPSRPSTKRNKQVKKTLHWMTEGMRLLVDAFGFSWLQAAGEAEAELAKMNELGVIDAVLTEDSDTMLFGACVVIRNPSYKRTDADVVTIYRATNILRDAGLSRGDLILLGLLLGSDYDPAGVPRCGARIARGLVKYGLGRSLYTALLSSSEEELRAFLPRWRHELCLKLRLDPNGFIGRQQPALAASIPPTFPDVDIARLFITPALLPPDRYACLREPRVMDLARLGELCEHYFSWGSSTEIPKTFRTALWPGEAVRMLVNEGIKTRALDTEARKLLDIVVISVDEPPAVGYAFSRVHLADNGFSSIATSSLRGTRPYRHNAALSEDAAQKEAARPLKAALPALIVERARPELVNPTYGTTGYILYWECAPSSLLRPFLIRVAP